MREDYQTSFVQQAFKNEGRVLSSKMNGVKRGQKEGKEIRALKEPSAGIMAEAGEATCVLHHVEAGTAPYLTIMLRLSVRPGLYYATL